MHLNVCYVVAEAHRITVINAVTRSEGSATPIIHNLHSLHTFMRPNKHWSYGGCFLIEVASN